MSTIADHHVTLKLEFTLSETALQVGGWISLEPTLGTHQRWGKAQTADPAGRNYLTVSVPKWAAYAARVDPRGHEIRLTLTDGQALPGDTITLVFGDTAGGGPGWSVTTVLEALDYFVRVCPDPAFPQRMYVGAQSYRIAEEHDIGSLQPRSGRRGVRSLKAARTATGKRFPDPEGGVMNVPGISIPGLPANCLMVGPFRQVGPFFERWLLHPYCELVHAGDGRATFSVDSQNYTLSAGRTLLIKSKRPHATRVAADQSFRGIYIHFAAHSMYHEIERINERILAAHQEEQNQSLGPLFQRVLDENVDMKRGAPNAADALLSLILVECFRIAGAAAPEEGDPVDGTGSSLKRISSACSQYINAHFHEPLMLSRVAAAICVSSFYLSHVFSRYMGITFTEYLTDVRMHHARTMLTESDRSIGEIADRTGYGDVYYFSKVFKRYHSLPPGVYRNRHRSGEALPRPLREASSA